MTTIDKPTMTATKFSSDEMRDMTTIDKPITREAALQDALEELMRTSRAVVGANLDDDRSSDAYDMYQAARDKARAALRTSAVPQAGEWQPIETAPKDGTRILLCRGTDTYGVVAGCWNPDKYAKRPRPFWDHDMSRALGIDNARKEPPTKWMPLPRAVTEDKTFCGPHVDSTRAKVDRELEPIRRAITRDPDDALTEGKTGPQAGEWQPIETAPKDHEILVCGGIFWNTADTYRQDYQLKDVATVCWDGERWRGQCSGSYDEWLMYEPKLWMPVPMPPSDLVTED